jgi:prephenate dehydratase
VFADRGLDLTKIESRPRKGRPFEYAFHADVVAKADASLEDALAALSGVAHDVRVLGTYPT